MSPPSISTSSRTTAVGSEMVSTRTELKGKNIVLPLKLSSLKDKIPRIIFPLIALIGLAIATHSAYISLRDMYIFPYWDMAFLQKVYFYNPVGEFFIFRDNEHLPFVAMPFFLVDNIFFQARGIFLVIVTLILNAVIVGLVLDELRRVWQKGHALSFAAAASFVVISMFWLIHFENLIWPKQIHMYLSAAFFVLASRMLAGMDEQVGSGTPPKWTKVLLMAALLSASMFSFGYGAIGWIAVLMLTITGRWPWRTVGALLAIFALNATVYAICYNYSTMEYHSNPLASFGSPFKLAEFTVAYFANPIYGLLRNRQAAAAVSLAGCLAALWILFRVVLLRRRSASRIELFASLLLLFAFGSALMTGLSRLKFGIETAGSPRYAIAQMPLWIGLGLIAVTALRERLRPWTPAVAVVGLIVAILFVQSQVRYERTTEKLSQDHWQGVLAVINGVADDEILLKTIYPDRQMIDLVAPKLAERHWSVYADPQPWWLGQPARDLFRVEAADRCNGSLDLVSDLGRLKGQSYVEGWAWDRNADRTPDWVVLVDGAGIVRGLARSGLKRPDVERALSAAAGSAPGWHGYVAAPIPLVGTEAYAVLADGSSICQLTRNAPPKAGDGVH